MAEVLGHHRHLSDADKTYRLPLYTVHTPYGEPDDHCRASTSHYATIVARMTLEIRKRGAYILSLITDADNPSLSKAIVTDAAARGEGLELMDACCAAAARAVAEAGTLTEERERQLEACDAGLMRCIARLEVVERRQKRYFGALEERPLAARLAEQRRFRR